jgi:glyoxylase-like metal-dependent hydrolase (beta-lactamase superfamily II)
VPKIPDSNHFTLQELAEGVYVAIAKPEGLAFANAAIIDLGGETLVLDSMNSQAAGADLRRAAEALMGRPVARLLVSHPHGDHWKGNGAFGFETRILATKQTRKLLEAEAAQTRALWGDPSSYHNALASYRQRLETERDPRWRTGLERSVRRVEHALSEIPDFVIRMPDETIKNKKTFKGSRRRARLVHLGAVHSRDDSYLVLPDDDLVFLADIGFFGELPVMVHCDVDAWRRQLDVFMDSGYETFVPGHGEVGGKAQLAEQRAYLDHLEEQVHAALAQGGAEAARAVEPGPPYVSWLDGQMARLEGNIDYFIDYLKKG